MKDLLEYLHNMRINSEAIGIQKDLLLAALIGVVSNLPKEVKSSFKQAVHIITGTLLSTIMTPMVIGLVESVFHTTLPAASGYGIASLIGIVGIGTIKKILISRFSTPTEKKDEDS